MKDFYDLWTILNNHKIPSDALISTVRKVFANRKTSLKYPASFAPAFYDSRETQRRWKTFLSAMGKDHIELEEVILRISSHIKFLERGQGLH